MTQEFRKFDLSTPWKTFPKFEDEKKLEAGEQQHEQETKKQRENCSERAAELSSLLCFVFDRRTLLNLTISGSENMRLHCDI